MFMKSFPSLKVRQRTLRSTVFSLVRRAQSDLQERLRNLLGGQMATEDGQGLWEAGADHRTEEDTAAARMEAAGTRGKGHVDEHVS